MATGTKDRKKLKEFVLTQVNERNIDFIRLQFVDILGTLKCCTITQRGLEDTLDDGVFFDGSSVEGFVRIFESDMYLLPDPSTFSVLPWSDEHAEARIICDVRDPDGGPFPGDPRHILQTQMDRAKKLGLQYLIGAELEFFLFKKEGVPNGQPPRPHDPGGYFDMDPLDHAMNIKKKAVMLMEAMGERIELVNGKPSVKKGIVIEMSHHEVAAGQHEIDFKYSDALTIADAVTTYKYVMKRIASENGLHASFMPKPLFGVNGSGMHTNQSLWDIKKGCNAFYDGKDRYQLSALAKNFLGGQLKHARALAGVLDPTVNSYKRLTPGYEAPVYICWGTNNRSALVRVPRTSHQKRNATRLELRCPDASCNPYLAFAAMLAAGLDGVENKIEPPKPVEEDVYKFEDRKLKRFYIKTLPADLGEAMQELKKSKLLKEQLGELTHTKLLAAQQRQWDEYRIQVTPWELATYYDQI